MLAPHHAAGFGTGPAHKVGRNWKFKKAQVDQWGEAGKAALKAGGMK